MGCAFPEHHSGGGHVPVKAAVIVLAVAAGAGQNAGRGASGAAVAGWQPDPGADARWPAVKRAAVKRTLIPALIAAWVVADVVLWLWVRPRHG